MIIYEFLRKEDALRYLEKPHMIFAPYSLSKSAVSGKWILEFESDEEIEARMTGE